MTKKEIRQFVKEQLFTKPIGKWNVIYGIWRGLIVLWWNTLIVWAAAATFNLAALYVIYGLAIIAAIFIYLTAKGR